MLLIILLLSCILFLFFLRRNQHHNLISKISFLVLCNWFLIEVLCFGYLLFLVLQGQSFLLIGHQRFLDHLIRSQIIQNLHFNERYSQSIYRTDSTLGYTVAENKFLGKHKATNSYGMRARREYSLIPSDDTLRMAVFGDSFVYCDGEYTQNTWPAILEKSFSNLEVLNFGVSGYGLGQSYKRYLNDGLLFSPDVIFFNYVQLGDRDLIPVKDIIEGRKLYYADLYRLRWGIREGNLASEAMTPLDLFSKNYRMTLIYKPAGLESQARFWENPIISFSNVALVVKQIVFNRVYLPRIKKTEFENYSFTLKVLDDLIQMAKRHQSTVIFFAPESFQNLPADVQQVLNRHNSQIIYVDATKELSAIWKKHNLQQKDILNETNHYNLKGNEMYARALAGVLVSRQSWGEGQRRFMIEPNSQKFIRIKN